MNPNQTVQNLKRKFSLIAQKNSVPYTNENGEFDSTWLQKMNGNFEVISTSTDIDTLKTKGEYWLLNATCSSGWPSDLPALRELRNGPTYTSYKAYIKIIPTETNDSSFPTTQLTQICLIYGVTLGASTTEFISAYIRTLHSAEGYEDEWYNTNIINEKKVAACGVNMSTPPTANIPSPILPNRSYFLGNFIKTDNNTSTIVSLSSLTLTNIPDSPYPIEFYFKTDSSFSGITATDIKAWIGNTTLNIDSAYKITIVNLIGTIEELTIPQQI